MKISARMTALLLALCLLAASFAGCAPSGTGADGGPEDSVPQTEAPSSGSQQTAAPAAPTAATHTAAPEVTAKPEVPAFTDADFDVKGYLLEVTDVGFTLYLASVTNNSQATVNVKGTAVAKDSAGSELSTVQGFRSTLGPGETSAVIFRFDGTLGVDSVDASLSYTADTSRQPVIGNISYEEIVRGSDVILRLTNNGTLDAQGVWVHVLFMDADGNPVDYRYLKPSWDDNMIFAGGSVATSTSTKNTFDHTEIFLEGWSDGTSTDISDKVAESDLELREYRYEDRGFSRSMLVVTNHSAYDLHVTANAAAYDKDGKLVGSSDGIVSVLGAGQSYPMAFAFSGAPDIDDIKYGLNYRLTPQYTSMTKDLALETAVSGNKVTVSVKNNGSSVLNAPMVMVLFFDGDGQMLGMLADMVRDDSGELKPGDTQSAEFDFRDPFADAEAFVTAEVYTG